MRTLITNIGFLTQVEESDISCRKGAEMKHLPVLENAFLLMEDGKYLDYGSMADAPERADETIDAQGGAVLPGWTDSHTHLVYSGSRELEYRDKILGLTYEQIAANGGGILNSAKRLQQTSEAELLDQAWARVQEIRIVILELPPFLLGFIQHHSKFLNFKPSNFIQRKHFSASSRFNKMRQSPKIIIRNVGFAMRRH